MANKINITGNKKRKRKRKNRGLGKAFKNLPKEVKQKIKADIQFQKKVAKENQQLQNPNQVNPFGSQTVTYDENGNPTVEQKLSEGQQGILEGGEGLTSTGQGITQDYLNNYQQFGPQDFGAKRAEIEDAVFGRLTKNMDQDYSNAKAAKEQELHNKGIPFSADPNSRYQQELGGIDRRFDEAKLQAKQQAVIQGGQEQYGQFGIEQGTHQQNFNDAAKTQGFGSGLHLPNFQGYQSTQLQGSNPIDVGFAMDQMNQSQQQIDLQKQQVNNQYNLGKQQIAATQQNQQQNQNQSPFN